MPTIVDPKEIEQEIVRLKELAPKIRQRNMFGDDNRAAIEAQIRVLSERMDEDAIYAAFPNEHTLSAALDAYEWVIGEGELQSTDWEDLVSA